VFVRTSISIFMLRVEAVARAERDLIGSKPELEAADFDEEATRVW
jgi:hypothetical protein